MNIQYNLQVLDIISGIVLNLRRDVAPLANLVIVFIVSVGRSLLKQYKNAFVSQENQQRIKHAEKINSANH
jgi:hypothetical protein